MMSDRPRFVSRLEGALRAGGEGGVSVVVVRADADPQDIACRRMNEALLAAGRPGEVVAALGTGVFGVLQPDGGEREAIALAYRLLTALGGEGVAGVVPCARPGADAGEVLEDAHIAADNAREHGPGAVEVFDPPMRRQLDDRRELGGDLRRAVEAEQLRLVYQPIVSLADGRAVAAEALLRWSHPVRGPIPAPELLALAAVEGLIDDIGRWVLREAAAQLARWDADERIRLDYVAVNVFPDQLKSVGLLHDLNSALPQTVEPGRIALEITEQAVSDSPAAAATIEQVRDLGVRLLLDDFGTGASSLRSLRHLPLDGVKIDGSFVAGLGDHAHDRHIAAAIIGMSGALGIDVIAEGVETADQARWLRRLGCAVAQGFVFARPAPPDDLAPLLAAGLAGEVPATALGPVQDALALRPAGDSRVRGEEQLVTLGEAAQLLGISASTARRWADSGRLRVIRTAGGHRRLARAEVERLAGGGTAVPVLRRLAEFPTAPPAVAGVLADGGGTLVTAAGRAIYEPDAAGWFAGEEARVALDRFALELAAAARSGDEQAGASAVRRLLDDAREAGVALIEADHFLGRYFALASRALHQQGAGEEELRVTRLIATSARHVLLEHADRR